MLELDCSRNRSQSTVTFRSIWIELISLVHYSRRSIKSSGEFRALVQNDRMDIVEPLYNFSAMA